MGPSELKHLHPAVRELALLGDQERIRTLQRDSLSNKRPAWPALSARR